jgi:hypothetical protein
VPAAAGRSLWAAAVWTGAGAALACAVAAIAIVAICWLPASGGSGSAGSAIRAGVLTFLAALHGGITVAGLSSAFVPLGMTLLVGAVAWRAGRALAESADQLGEDDARRLVRAGATQLAAFVLLCGIAAGAVRLGTSSASVTGAVLAATLLFGVAAGTAYVLASPLRSELRERIPEWLAAPLPAAAAAVIGYLGVGALLVAASLVVHHGRVETLSAQVGGGWSGVPVLLLGVLAAPNAAIAGASYLAGPGFALGTGNGVRLGSAPHGTLPAFPVLGAVPTGPANTAAWLLAAATPVVGGLALARVARRAEGWPLRMRDAALASALAGLAGAVLAWQGGGGIGAGRLSALGASPWQFGLAVTAGVLVVSEVALGAFAALDWWRSRDADAQPVLRATLAAVGAAIASKPAPDEPAEEDKLAG